jgi:hypothetical protein
MLKNWKTTLGGVGVILSTIGNAITEYQGGGIAGINFSVLLAGLSMGFGLLVAKDFNVSGVGPAATTGPTAPVK